MHPLHILSSASAALALLSYPIYQHVNTIDTNMVTSFLINNKRANPSANQFIRANETGDAVFYVNADTVTGPWSCNFIDTGIVIDSVEPTPIPHAGTGYVFGPTQSIRFMFHVVPHQKSNHTISCDTQSVGGERLSGLVRFRSTHDIGLAPMVMHDAAVGTVSPYPGP